MYLIKLVAHASLTLWMFEKMTFTSLHLTTLIIIPNLMSSCFCPTKKWRKTLYGEGLETGTLDIFSLYRSSPKFLLTGNQFLLYIMVYVECRKLPDKWSLRFFREMLLNFYSEWGGEMWPLHRNYGIVVILLSFLCNYDNLILKLHHENSRYLMKDGFLLTDSKLEVCQKWVLLL